jgi:hypothetical protein
MTASAAMSFEIDSDVAIEYGLNLPHSGDEPAWFAGNAEALSGISGTSLWPEDRARGRTRTPAAGAGLDWARAANSNPMFVRWRFSNHTRD